MKEPVLIITFLLSFCFLTVAHAQGGEGMAPTDQYKLEEKTDLTELVGQDVSTSNGALNVSYPVGTVSTLKGNSFTLTITNSSKAIATNNLPAVKDGLVGEGWAMNVPSLSLSISGESNFTYQELEDFRNNQQNTSIPPSYFDNDELTPYFGATGIMDWNKLAKEGKLYFFNIKVNIPGVYSGDMVYKYAGDKMVNDPYPPISGPESNIYEHVFVPEQFERYFELRYNGVNWVVTLDDGTRYVFSDGIFTQYEATNQRVNVEDLMASGLSKDYISDNFLPRYIPTQYYCSSIKFKDDPDIIFFEYEGAGSFDRFKEARSNEVDNYLNNPSFPYPNENIEDPVDLYSELILKRISSRIRALDLHYEIDQDFLDKVYGSGVIDPEHLEKKDIRYYKRTAEHWGINTEGFHSYPSPANTNSGISNTQVLANPSPNNPFTYSYGGKETYLFQYVKQPYFDYGILESPKIELSKFKAGNIYEVRAQIKSLTDSPSCMFDINVVTGNSLFTTYNKDANVGINNTTYNHFRPVSLFNTFNRGIKWSNLNRIISPADDIRQTSNYFTVPVLAPQMHGVYIQIGPGNNEQIYTLNTENINDITLYGCDLIDNNIPHSIHKFYNSFHADNHNGINVPKSGDRMRGHFGTGYPWLCLSDMYGGSFYKFGLRSNPFDQNETQGLGDASWWCPKNLQNTAMCYIENKPVRADPLIALYDLELVEYIKMPLVLKSAASKITNPGAHVDPEQFSTADIYQVTDSVFFVYKNVIRTGYGVGYYDMDPTVTNPYYLQTSQVFSLLREIHSKKVFDDQLSSDPLVTKFGYEYRSGSLLPQNFMVTGDLPNVYNSPTGYYAFLLDTIRQVNGKRIFYSYNDLNLDNFRLRSNISGIELFGLVVFGRSSTAKKYGPANGFSSIATIEVSTKWTDYAEGGRLNYKYTYGTRVEKTSAVSFISYLKSLNSHNLHYYPVEAAFTTVTVVGPYIGSVPYGLKTVYHNNVDANPLFGKTDKIVKYNDAGSSDLLSETEYYYNQAVAYLPGAQRGNMHYYRYDYEDLETTPPDPDLGLSSRAFRMTPGGLPNGKAPEFLGNQTGLTLYSSSYFTGLQKVITREYIPVDGGIKKEKKVEYEYCGADADGTPYTGWKSAFLYGNIPSRLRYEPSWQRYKTTTTVGNQVDVEESFYLWDLMNIVTYENAADFTIGLDCFRKMDRTRLIHKRITRTKGDGDPSSTNEYYVYKAFEPVSDATVISISIGNAQCPQSLDPPPDPVLLEKRLVKAEENVNEFPAYLNSSAKLTDVPVFNFPVIRTRKIEKYNQNLQVTEEFDVNDVKTTYDYGGTTRINVKKCYTIGSDPTIHVDNYAYDICRNYGAPASITREHGNQEYVTAYTGERGKLKTITDPAGNTTANTYDGHMRVIEQKLNGNKMKKISYHVNDLDETDYSRLMMGNYVTIWSYYTATQYNTSSVFTGLDGQQLCIIDNGVVRDYKLYDDLLRVFTEYYPFYGDETHLEPPSGGLSMRQYQYIGNTGIISQIKDFGHNIDKYILHEYAKVPSISPLAAAAGITYPSSPGTGLYSHTITDQDGKETSTVYNQAGQVLLTTSDGGAIGTAFTYHSTGGVETIINPNAQSTVNHYNHFGQVYKTVSAFYDAELLYAYDKAGNRVLSRDGEEEIRRYTYDGFNQMTGQYRIDADPEIFEEKGLLPVLNPATGAGAAATAEKELYYGPVSASQFPGVIGSLNSYFTHGGYPGKPSATKSYNRAGKPVDYTGFVYDHMTGEVGGMGRQFNPNSLEEYGENYATAINYGDGNYLNTPRSKMIDLNADGKADFYYWYAYDNYNRLTEVYANYTNSKTNGNKVVTYTYEPLSQLLGSRSYYATNRTGDDPGCTTCHALVDNINYGYDLQGRLLGIDGTTMSEALFYDGKSIIDDIADQPNYNGNINATQFIFSEGVYANINGNPPVLIKNSSWEYEYDGANRLTGADYYRYTDPETYTTAREEYAYDNAGNTMEMDLIQANMTPFVVDIFRNGNNSRITGLDIAPPQPVPAGASGVFSYDGNGVVTDYGKASMHNIRNGKSHMPESFYSGMQPSQIPEGMAPNNIMDYDAFDQRIFKATFSNTRNVSVSNIMEYYIRDDKGRELGVYDMNKKRTTWYIYGLDRVAEITHEAACLVPVIIPISGPGGPGGPPVEPPHNPPFLDTLGCFDKYEWSIKHNDVIKNSDFNTTDKAKLAGIATTFTKDSCYDKYEYYNHYTLHTVRRSGDLELVSTAQLSDPAITEILDTIPINPNTQMVRLRGLDGGLRIAEMRYVLGDTTPRQQGTPGPGPGTETAQIFESCQSKFKYYIYDHLGNTRIVYGAELPACGQAPRRTLTSMTDYSPYGNILQRYSFQGRRTRFMTTYHERDSTTLLDYRGARFSDPHVGGFLSLDPLAGERPGFSPYNYVSCNPISRVDPTGMIDDTYSVDGEGNITKIDDKKYYDDNGNEVDLLVRGRNVRYDKSGNVKNEHIYLKAGYLREGTKEKAFQVEGRTYKYSHLSFGADESESTRTFEFLAENTEVEWSLIQTKLFSKTNNELFTSHIWNEELAAPSLLMADPDKLKSLISDIHSHPPTHMMSDESRLRPSDEDKNFAKRVRQTNPGAIMKIYFNGQYMQY